MPPQTKSTKCVFCGKPATKTNSAGQLYVKNTETPSLEKLDVPNVECL